MKYRVIVADDEDVARKRLIRLLNECASEFEVVAEAANGNAACEVIERHKPDLAFLDIQMPGMSGIEVAQKSDYKPFVIFVTAFNQYALEAFKVLSIDYLLKPVDEISLRDSLEKFKRIAHPSPDYGELLGELAERLGNNKHRRIAISTGDSIKFIAYDDIICFEADNKYTTICTRKAEHLTEMSLIELERTLPKNSFVRIHRKHIVNIHYIDEISKWFDRRLKIKLNIPFDKELIVGREYVDRVRNL